MSRVRLNLNREWKFFRGDLSGAEAVNFDDSSWESIGLPHTFDLPYFRSPEFYVGYGWYRKRFAPPVAATPASPSSALQRGDAGVAATERQRRFFLEFDGVFQVAEVFVNGRRVGEHRGGYTGFQFDVTCFVEPGENFLAVRVNNNWNRQLAPRAGEHIFSGGVYRDVHLLVTDSLHVTWNDICVTTPHVSREHATIRVATEIFNRSDRVRRVVAINRVVAPNDHHVAGDASATDLPAGETRIVEQTIAVVNPELWHPSHPCMYLMQTALLDLETQREVDKVVTPFGFRWFEWKKDRGFFLNGEHLYLRGANAHQDHAGWGIGITRAACERDVKLIKDAGFNFVRGSHYPHHPAFADACDKHGLLFMTENCFWGKGGFGPEGYWNASAYPVNPQDFEPFEEHCKQTLREMIRIGRNHPSIIAWSMCNEPFFTYNLDLVKNLLRDLVKLSHELDPTRPATIGGAQRGDIDQIGDVAGYNGDGARLFIDPGVANLVSEYGAISKPHNAYEPFFGELQPEQFPWRVGQAIWCAFDYGTIAGKQGLKGIVDHARLPKRSWYWYRNEYLGIAPPRPPAEGVPSRLRLSADKTTIQGTDATDDCQIVVTVCDADGNHVSDSPPVTLTIESGPGEFPTGRSITFDPETDIKIGEGQAAIAFRSYHGGESVIRASSPGLEDATITIVTNGLPSFDPLRTALAVSRPYTSPKMSDAALRAMQNVVNVALDRPCRASSELLDHPARYANDGNLESFWRADDHDLQPWWQVDLEGFYQVSGSRLTFASPADRYRIEISEDGKIWTVAVDRAGSSIVGKVHNDIYPPGEKARYVRVTFFGRAELREFELFGVLSLR